MGKYKGIFPYHAVAFVMLAVTKIVIEKPALGKGLRMMFSAIPNFFLIEMSGYGEIGINHIEWYISAMLLCMFIIYPILRANYDMLVKVIGPICALFILGYMYHTTRGFTGVLEWMGFGYKSVFRAFAEILLGCTAFEICRIITEKKEQLSVKLRIALTGTELLCYAFTIGFIFSNLPREYELFTLMALFVGVTLSFSNVTYGALVFQNKFSFFLGKASLPIYLSQLSVITIVLNCYRENSFSSKLLITFVFIACYSTVCYVGGNLIKRMINVNSTQKK